MVFSVIESDITKSGQALSIFGKELQNVYHDFNSAIHSIKTKTGDISQFSIGRILGNKLSQQDIDSIRRYNDEIRKYNEMTDDAITPQTAFYKCLGNSSSAAQRSSRQTSGISLLPRFRHGPNGMFCQRQRAGLRRRSRQAADCLRQMADGVPENSKCLPRIEEECREL